MASLQSITLHSDGYILLNGQKVNCSVNTDTANQFESPLKLTGTTGIGRVIGALGAKFEVATIVIGALEVIIELSNGQRLRYACTTQRNYVKSNRYLAPDGEPQVLLALTARLSDTLLLDW